MNDGLCGQAQLLWYWDVGNWCIPYKLPGNSIYLVGHSGGNQSVVINCHGGPGIQAIGEKYWYFVGITFLNCSSLYKILSQLPTPTFASPSIHKIQLLPGLFAQITVAITNAGPNAVVPLYGRLQRVNCIRYLKVHWEGMTFFKEGCIVLEFGTLEDGRFVPSGL